MIRTTLPATSRVGATANLQRDLNDRLSVMAGPALALDNVHNRAGGGRRVVVWWGSRRFGVEWQAQPIVTASPLRATDIAPSSQGVRIQKPQNGHTTIGIRYRFQS